LGVKTNLGIRKEWRNGEMAKGKGGKVKQASELALQATAFVFSSPLRGEGSGVRVN